MDNRIFIGKYYAIVSEPLYIPENIYNEIFNLITATLSIPFTSKSNSYDVMNFTKIHSFIDVNYNIDFAPPLDQTIANFASEHINLNYNREFSCIHYYCSLYGHRALHYVLPSNTFDITIKYITDNNI